MIPRATNVLTFEHYSLYAGDCLPRVSHVKPLN